MLGCAVVLCVSTSAAGKRPARGKCKHGTVPVKVEGKTRCQKLRGAIPRPQPGDPRVGFFQAALGANVGVARDRHGRKLTPLAQVADTGSPGHWSIWGIPDVLASCVTDVSPVRK